MSANQAKGKEQLVKEEPQVVHDPYIVDFASGLDPMTAL